MRKPRIQNSVGDRLPSIQLTQRAPVACLYLVLERIHAMPTSALRAAAVADLPAYLIEAWRAHSGQETLAQARQDLSDRQARNERPCMLLDGAAMRCLEGIAEGLRTIGGGSVSLPLRAGSIVTIHVPVRPAALAA